ncbi:MAG: D-alanyl-D-alanine carboxypeptidase [Oscillospiraceae bacterium]|nr:D-alanyl-D-alanine carboxypeptidase [Oscillospiraceae bacterium]
MMLKKLLSLIIILLFFAQINIVNSYAITVSQLDRRIFSETAILIDADTGQILYEKNMHKIMRPASITKIMTALLALEHGDMDDIITMSHEAINTLGDGAASIFLVPGERIRLEDALYAMAVVSANDASNGVAEHIGGTISHFVELMNIRAIEEGAINTNFTNTHGMPDNNHLSTAYDMARIAMAAVRTPGFNEMYSTHRYEMPGTNRRTSSRVFRNRNRMMTGAFVYNDLIAGKTGWTRSSEHTLFTAAKRGDRTIIGILLKSHLIDDKYKDMTTLFNYGFNNFVNVSFSTEELEDHTLTDSNGRELDVELTVHEEFTCLIPRSSSKNDVKVEYIIQDSDIENELHVRIVFTLDDPVWLSGSAELGETLAFAILPEVIEDDVTVTVEETPEPSQSQEPSEPIEPPEPPELSQPNQSPSVENEQTENVSNIQENHLFMPYPFGIWHKTDVSLLMALCTIIFSVFTIRKKRLFHTNNHSNES